MSEDAAEMAGAPEAARARGALPPISIERANSPSLGVLSPTRRSPARHSPASHSPTRHSPPTKPPFVRASSEQLEGCSAQRDDPSPHGLTIQCLGSPRIQSLSLELGHADGVSPSAGGGGGGGFSTRSSVCSLEDSWKGEIIPEFLYLGDRVTASDWDRLSALGVTHILNVSTDVSHYFESEPSVTYMRCPVEDRSNAAEELARHFDACVAFLDGCRADKGRALVHCRAGVSRSATVVIGYLMRLHRWDLKTALRHVDSRRFVQPNSGFINFLIGVERALFGKCELSVNDFGYAPSGPSIF